MLNTKRANDAVARHLPPGFASSSTVNINGGSIIDVARDYHNHGDVYNSQRISIHQSTLGWFELL